jgi:hypothetical protein
MDFSRLRTGEKIAGGSAIALFIIMFFSWYGVKGTDITVSAWKAFSTTDLLLMLTILVALGMVALTALGQTVSLPVALSVIATVLAGFATLVVLFRILNQPGPNELVTVQIGAYLGLLATAGIAYGAFRSMADEGATFGDARAQVGSALGGDRAADATPPPPSPAADVAVPRPAEPTPPSTPPPSQPPPGSTP